MLFAFYYNENFPFTQWREFIDLYYAKDDSFDGNLRPSA